MGARSELTSDALMTPQPMACRKPVDFQSGCSSFAATKIAWCTSIDVAPFFSMAITQKMTWALTVIAAALSHVLTCLPTDGAPPADVAVAAPSPDAAADTPRVAALSAM